MTQIGRDCKDHVVPTRLPGAGLPPTRSFFSCSSVENTRKSELGWCGAWFLCSLFQSHPEVAKLLATCPFNARHLVPRADLVDHIAKCRDKGFIEHDIGKRALEMQVHLRDWRSPVCPDSSHGKQNWKSFIVCSFARHSSLQKPEPCFSLLDRFIATLQVCKMGLARNLFPGFLNKMVVSKTAYWHTTARSCDALLTRRTVQIISSHWGLSTGATWKVDLHQIDAVKIPAVGATWVIYSPQEVGLLLFQGFLLLICFVYHTIPVSYPVKQRGWVCPKLFRGASCAIYSLFSSLQWLFNCCHTKEQMDFHLL